MTVQPLRPPTANDETRRAPANQAEARAELHRRFAPVVHGIALAIVGPRDADDVTQDVFLKVFRSLQDVRDPDALAAWVCGVARNAARDWLRRQRRRPAVPLDGEPRAPERDEDDLAERVLALVRTLPDAYRETLVLRLVEGLSGVEIAERTGLTHGSVRVNLHRGMNMLRPLLQNEGW